MLISLYLRFVLELSKVLQISSHCDTMTWANDMQQCDNKSYNNDGDNDDNVCLIMIMIVLMIYEINHI